MYYMCMISHHTSANGSWKNTALLSLISDKVKSRVGYRMQMRYFIMYSFTCDKQLFSGKLYAYDNQHWSQMRHFESLLRVEYSSLLKDNV